MHDELFEKALAFHKANKGKIEIKSKTPLNDRETLSLAYTPGVAEVSRKIGEDPSRAYDYTLKQNTVAIVSDGSAILGLGNLGAAAAIPVMEGKAAIFKERAGIDAFPICLDTQDTEEIIATVKRIAPVFGGINLEDIAAPRCFEIERRLRSELPIPVMHDDQHGTATVVLAALLNALKVTKRDKNVRIVVNGVGAAGVATTRILLGYGFSNIVLCDSTGAIYAGRDGLAGDKKELSERTNLEKRTGSLADVIAEADVFIGVSRPGLLTEDMVRSMAKDPIIFALANPMPEIMPDAAKNAGALIIATGRSDFPNQINNSLAFPGIFRGALDNRIRQFDERMFVRAAELLAACVPEPKADALLPLQFDEHVVSAIKEAIRE